MTLGDFVTLQRGHDLPTEQRSEGKVPILGSFGITGWHNEAKAKGPGVTVGRSGGSIGVVSYTEDDYWPLNTALYVKDFHGNHERFAYYFLQTLNLAQYNSGSAQPSLNRNHIHPMPIFVPEVEQQKAIADALGALDDKIELNRQINATLESMAQALFKSWFVDFDPVIDNALAAGNDIPEPLQAKADKRAGQHVWTSDEDARRASATEGASHQRKPLPDGLQQQFPDRFVFTEEIGWVPEGWKVCSFGKLIEHTIGGDWGKEDLDEKHTLQVSVIRGTDIPSVCAGSRGAIPVRWVEEKKFRTRELIDGDIVLEVSGGSPKQPTGRAALVTQQSIDQLGGSVVPASFCRKLRPTSVEHGVYGYLHLSRIYGLGKMWGYQNQSTGISNFQTKVFMDAEPVILPSSELVLKEFYKMVRPLIDRSRSRESEALSALRDTLLPKLLSGELRIPEAEKQVAEAV